MHQDKGPLSRRALIAALVGGGTALAARAVGAPQLANAADPPVRLGATNVAADDTVVQNTSTATTARGLAGRARGSGVSGSHSTTGNTGALGQSANGAFGQAFSTSGNGVRGVANNGLAAYGVWGSAQGGTGVVGHGPTGVAGASFATNGTGVKGTANTGAAAAGVAGASSTGFGVAGRGLVGAEGATVAGTDFGRLGQTRKGVEGISRTTNGTGVKGEASTGALSFGVWGVSRDGYAGWFSGDVEVTGSLDAAAAAFLVDHPDDPERRLLSQAYVASDERLSTYSGNVTTDADGRATVRLPRYVSSLNADFRYQLTVVGGFAQAIVAQKVRDGRFQIRTSEPGVEVSWQVTGVRADAWSRRNPFVADRAKRGAMAGRLLRPEVHGRGAASDVTAALGAGGRRRAARGTSLDIERKIRHAAEAR